MGMARLTMRILGYALLILGFVGMPVYFQAGYHAIKGQTLAHAANSLLAGGDTRTYSLQESNDAFKRAFDETAKSIPLIFPPTILMLAGGILLDVANRRQKKTIEQPQSSFQPSADARSGITVNCNLTRADYRAFYRYYLFRYRKMHWLFGIIIVSMLSFVWYSNKPNATAAERISGIVGFLIGWMALTVIFVLGWMLLRRLTGGRFRGSIGSHVFEIGEDTFVESNAEGRKEIKIAGLRHLGETDSYFFVMSRAGSFFVVPKRDLQNSDALHALKKKVTAL